MLPKFEYVRAGSTGDAVRLLGSDGSRLHAGGTDLLGCLHDGVFGAERLVSLRDVEELRGIETTTDGSLRIGAMTTVIEVAESSLVKERFPGLAQAASDVASPQLRNQGTLGGNLCQRPRCWYFRGDFHCAKKGGDECYAVGGENRYHAILGGGPCFIVHPSDTAPMLMALGAAARIAGPDGERTVPLEEFFVLPETDLHRENVLDPGEILTEVLVPPPRPYTRSSYRKVRERGSWDFALVSVALAATMNGAKVADARVVLGGVAPVPWRSKEAEAAIRGKTLDERSASQAATAAVTDAMPLDRNEYKVPLLQGAMEESLLAL
jgi:xanthine dehydrogenase YagS FAD-binding subunit